MRTRQSTTFHCYSCISLVDNFVQIASNCGRPLWFLSITRPSLNQSKRCTRSIHYLFSQYFSIRSSSYIFIPPVFWTFSCSTTSLERNQLIAFENRCYTENIWTNRSSAVGCRECILAIFQLSVFRTVWKTKQKKTTEVF